MGSEANAVQLDNGEVKAVELEESGVAMGGEANAVQLGNGEMKAVKLEESGVTMGSEANAVQPGNGEVKLVKLEESGVTMGSEADAVQLGNGEVKAVKLEDENNIEAKNVVKHLLPPMMPASPDARGEGINVPSNFTSPSTVRTSPPELDCVDAHQKCHAPGSPDASSPLTPKVGSFDPFAPGLDELVMAPRGSRYSREERNSSPRSIKFGSSVRLAIEEYCDSDEENGFEEERLLNFLYNDLLEVIVSTQVYSVQHDTFLDEVFLKLLVLAGYKTPEPLLTGIADTCPPAPVKFERKAAIIDRGLCRKLDF